MADEPTGRTAFFVIVAVAALFMRLISRWRSEEVRVLAGIGFSIVIGGLLAGVIVSGLAPVGLKEAVAGYLVAVGVGFGGGKLWNGAYWLLCRLEKMRTAPEHIAEPGLKEYTETDATVSTGALTRRDEDE